MDVLSFKQLAHITSHCPIAILVLQYRTLLSYSLQHPNLFIANFLNAPCFTVWTDALNLYTNDNQVKWAHQICLDYLNMKLMCRRQYRTRWFVDFSVRWQILTHDHGYTKDDCPACTGAMKNKEVEDRRSFTANAWNIYLSTAIRKHLRKRFLSRTFNA